MNIAVVNPFDPPPGDLVREGRYAAFCRALATAGHSVAWYSSDWSHALKQPRDAARIDAACRDAGFRIELCPTRPYRRNVELARWRSHAALAEDIPAALDRANVRPDAVLVSTPPPALAAAVARWAASRGTSVVIDIQDLWPETFGRLWPRGLKWINSVAGRSMRADVRAAYGLADAGIAAARGYAEHFLAAAPDRPCHTLHLGVDLDAFDRAVGPLAALGPALTDVVVGKRWIFVGGSLGLALDWRFMLDLAARLGQGTSGVHMMVVGTGPAEEGLRRQIARRVLGNVHLAGQQSYAAFCTLAAASDFALNHYRADSFVFFPNRVFDFFAADLPIINTVGGEIAETIATHGAGFNTTDFDVEEAARYVEAEVVRRPPAASRPAPRDRRGAWVAEFDRRAIAARLPRILEDSVAARRASGQAGSAPGVGPAGVGHASSEATA